MTAKPENKLTRQARKVRSGMPTLTVSTTTVAVPAAVEEEDVEKERQWRRIITTHENSLYEKCIFIDHRYLSHSNAVLKTVEINLIWMYF